MRSFAYTSIFAVLLLLSASSGAYGARRTLSAITPPKINQTALAGKTVATSVKAAANKTAASAVKQATGTANAVKASADKAAAAINAQAAKSIADISSKANSLAGSIKNGTQPAVINAKLNSTVSAIKSNAGATLATIKAGVDSTLNTLIGKANSSVSGIKTGLANNLNGLKTNVTGLKNTTGAKVDASVAAAKNAATLTGAVLKNITATIKANSNPAGGAAQVKKGITDMMSNIKSANATNNITAAAARLAAPLTGANPSTLDPAQLAVVYQALTAAGVPVPDVATILSLGQGVIIPAIYSVNNLTDLADQVAYSVANGSPLLVVDGKAVIPGIEEVRAMAGKYLGELNNTVVPASTTGSTAGPSSPVTLLNALVSKINVTGLVDMFIMNVTGDVVNSVLSDIKSQVPKELAPFVPNSVSSSSLKDVFNGLRNAVAAAPALGTAAAPAASNQRTGTPAAATPAPALPPISVTAVKQAALALLPTLYQDLSGALGSAGIAVPSQSIVQSFITNLPETAPTATNGVDPSVVDALSAGVASALRAAGTTSAGSNDLAGILGNLIGSGSSASSDASSGLPSVVSGVLGGLGLGNTGSSGQNVLQNIGAVLGALGRH